MEFSSMKNPMSRCRGQGHQGPGSRRPAAVQRPCRRTDGQISRPVAGPEGRNHHVCEASPRRRPGNGLQSFPCRLTEHVRPLRSRSVFGSSLHTPSEPRLSAIGCSTAPMASNGASCRFYFGPEECNEVRMLEETCHGRALSPGNPKAERLT
jgi:hypothetical protein